MPENKFKDLVKEWDHKTCVVCSSSEIDRYDHTLPAYECPQCLKTYWLKQITLTIITSIDIS